MIKKNRGYLLMIAIFILVFGSLLAVSVSHLITNKSMTASNSHNGAQAFYLATAGLERAMQAMASPTIGERVSCSDLTGHSDFTNITLGSGEFTVTSSIVTVNNITLTSSISSTTTIIPISSLTGITSSGQVMIDSEAINYTNYSSVSGDCAGNAPCLIGVTRGADNSTATTHNSGTMVSQSRCHITSTGYIPSASNPSAKRVVGADSFGFAFGWAVGDASGGESIFNYDGSGWSAYTPPSALPNKNLYDVAMINYSDAWMVGQKESNNALLLHWDGSDWTQFNPSNSIPNKDLNGVACISSDDCWAVGNNSTFIHWDGSDWSNGTVDTSIPNKTITKIACTATDNCWAVGVQQGSTALLARWNGTTWSRVIPDASVDNGLLYDVTCLASNNCWAVGNGKKFVQWDGASWSQISPESGFPNKALNSISCTASNSCWAVGQSGTFAYWNGSVWSEVTPEAGVATNVHYNGINCMNANNCWAVGTGGSVAFWNGSTWEDDSSGLSGENLNSVFFIGSQSTTGSEVKNWQEE